MIVTARALASMLFSTSSAMAFRGFDWDSAMMVMAFQSSPILNLPRASPGSRVDLPLVTFNARYPEKTIVTRRRQ
jgi:hypothetical protein